MLGLLLHLSRLFNFLKILLNGGELPTSPILFIVAN